MGFHVGRENGALLSEKGFNLSLYQVLFNQWQNHSDKDEKIKQLYQWIRCMFLYTILLTK